MYRKFWKIFKIYILLVVRNTDNIMLKHFAINYRASYDLNFFQNFVIFASNSHLFSLHLNITLQIHIDFLDKQIHYNHFPIYALDWYSAFISIMSHLLNQTFRTCSSQFCSIKAFISIPDKFFLFINSVSLPQQRYMIKLLISFFSNITILSYDFLFSKI